MLFSESATPATVTAGLDDMIARLQQIPAGWARPDSWPAVQNSYLQLVETIENALRSWFDDDDGATQGLYGEHYKLIRGMTASTPRPSPLINDEAARQVRALETLKGAVAGLQALRSREGQIAVLDTNVLMHYQRPDKIAWADILGVPQVRIILPVIVIDELDNKKYTGSDRMSRRAGLAIAALRQHSASLRPGGAAMLPDGTTLEVFLDEPGHARMPNPDEELRSRCMLLQRAISRPVTIVTGDLGAQLRAGAHGLSHAEMPAKYAKDALRRASVSDD
ncbi:MAG: PIN domain-containing protein [Streptosporangiaceae bacterium]